MDNKNISPTCQLSSFKLFLLEFSLMLSLTWMVWQRLVFNTPGAWLVHVSLGGLVFVMLLTTAPGFSKLILSPPFIFLGLWGLFNTVNMMFIDEWHEKGSIVNLLYPYIFACLAAFAVRVNFDRTIKCLLAALFIYLASFLMHSEMHVFADSSRLIGSNFNSNEIAQLCVVILALFAVTRLTQDKFGIVRYILLGAVCVILVMLGSRNAATCGFLMVFAFFTVKLKSSSFSTFKLLILLLVFIFIANIVLSHTELGIRFHHTAEEADVNTFWGRMLGERYYYYVLGTDIFLQKPWTGCGFRNFILYNPRGFSCHVEYIAQLAEGGIISFTLFFLMLFPMFIKSGIYQALDKKRTGMYLAFMYLLTLLVFCVASIISFKLDTYIILVLADYLYHISKPSPAETPAETPVEAPAANDRPPVGGASRPAISPNGTNV